MTIHAGYCEFFDNTFFLYPLSSFHNINQTADATRTPNQHEWKQKHLSAVALDGIIIIICVVIMFNNIIYYYDTT